MNEREYTIKVLFKIRAKDIQDAHNSICSTLRTIETGSDKEYIIYSVKDRGEVK